jgi:hypothetical protein
MNRALALWVGKVDEPPSFTQQEAVDELDRSKGYWVEFWSVEPSGDIEADMARGEAYAKEAITYNFYHDGYLELVLFCICRKL